MGEEKIITPLQESLNVAVKTGAMKPSDTRRVIVDTTVEPKNVMFPTDAKLINRAREKLVMLAKKLGVDLRQSYVRVGKLALIKHQRYAHAKQFKRANRALRKLRTYLGRTTRDITRKIAGEDSLKAMFKRLLNLSGRVLEQNRDQRGPKVYSLHAPEVECIGKGKPHRPYEFGVKVSLATTSNARRAASSRSTPRRCPAILMTATPSKPSSPRSNASSPTPEGPQRALEPQVQGLHLRPEAKDDTLD
jgi:IS5 family transposase